mmetsp:Transcript_16926/g.39420  ORF Transcript_16926/g.39420 Transcript_16926/m.39420 type:complete len:805 (+) Transcript_16926:75-2489(+)
MTGPDQFVDVSNVYRHAAVLLEKLGGAGSVEEVHAEILEYINQAAQGSTPVGQEDVEHAVMSKILALFEDGDAVNMIPQVLRVLEVCHLVIFSQLDAQSPTRNGANLQAGSDSEPKLWTTSMLDIYMEVARIMPTQSIGLLVNFLEKYLVSLTGAYVRQARVRLGQWDAKQAEEVKATEDAKAGGKDASGKASKSEEKRIEDRKKQIQQLAVHPNSAVYLTVTSLLKQISARLCASTDAELRARTMLLLEEALPMDHKAIANNSKQKSTDYLVVADLDTPGECELKQQPTGEGEGKPKEPADPSTQQAADGQKIGKMAGKQEDVDTVVLDYQFYKDLWSMQELLHNPDKLIDSKANNMSWSKHGVDFQHNLKNIFTFMEKHPAQDDTSLPWVAPQRLPLRHAPRGWALEVQLKEGHFRLVFLTQVMIAFHTMEHKSTLAAAVSPLNDGMKKILAGLRERCEAIMEQARPGYSKTLAWMLEQEVDKWVSWKLHGCQEFEHDSLEMLCMQRGPLEHLPEDGQLTRPRHSRPTFQSHVATVLKYMKDPQWRLLTQTADAEDSGKVLRLNALHQTCDTRLERLIEDEKPENEIEEEYKAKKNKVWMWQCRRVFSHQHLRAYASKEAQVSKADFLDYVYIAKGIPLPKAMKRASGLEATATVASAPDQSIGGAEPPQPEDMREASPVEGSPEHDLPVADQEMPDGIEVQKGNEPHTEEEEDEEQLAEADMSALQAELAAADREEETAAEAVVGEVAESEDVAENESPTKRAAPEEKDMSGNDMPPAKRRKEEDAAGGNPTSTQEDVATS